MSTQINDGYYYLEWLTCVYCWMLLFVTLFYLHTFWKHRKTALFKKRYFVFVFGTNLCAIFFTGYLAPMWILTHLTHNINISDAKYGTLFDVILGFPYIATQHIFICLIFSRFWILHYDIMYSFHLKQLDILTKINPKSLQLSWYINNRQIFGHLGWFSTFSFGLCFIIILISSITYKLYFNGSTRYIWYFSDTLLIVIPFIIALNILYKTPKFFDYFLIRKELSIIMICSTIGIIGFIITSILCLYIPSNTLFNIIGIIFGASIYTTIALTSTFWILQFSVKSVPPTPSSTSIGSIELQVSLSDSENITTKMGKKTKTKTKTTRNASDNNYIPKIVLNNIHSSRLYDNGDKKAETELIDVNNKQLLLLKELTLYDTLENKYGFYAFLLHANKEYSIENVLAVIELHQFQLLYKGKKRSSTKTRKPNPNPDPDVPVSFQSIASQSRSTARNVNINIEENKEDKSAKNRSNKLIRMTSIDDLCNVEMRNHSFQLPPLIPQSSIVYGSAFTMREKIVQLCDRYIVAGGEFELNLGSSHRQELLKKKSNLNKCDDDECAAIFNATIYGVIALMHDSFIRFQQTSSYDELRKEFAKPKQ